MHLRASRSVICILLITASARAQTILYVDDDGDTENGCSSWEDACRELQTALTLAGVGDQVWVASGTYKPDYDSATMQHNGDRLATFQLISGVEIYGGFQGTESSLEERIGLFDQTILSGDLAGDDEPDFLNNEENSYHVVNGSGTDGSAILDGFKITGGNADEGFGIDRRGGGLVNDAGSPSISQCVFEGSSAVFGGGMANMNLSRPMVLGCVFTGNRGTLGGGGLDNAGAWPVVQESLFEDNSAGTEGGGVRNFETHTNSGDVVTLLDCTFRSNIAAIGAGMWMRESDVVLVDCDFIENVATPANGGGLYAEHSSSATIDRCRFLNNTAHDSGGGLDLSGLEFLITSSVISGNSAGIGGGFHNNHATDVIISNCTLSHNSATIAGGGVQNELEATTVVNSILWGNDLNGVVNEDAQIRGGEPSVRFSCIQGLTGALGGAGNIGDDPLFVDATAADYHLQPASPCIDAGFNHYLSVPNTDFERDDRIQRCRVDMGADETSVLTDCNDNGSADSCDLYTTFVDTSPELGPVDNKHPHTYVVLDPPEPLFDVIVRLTAVADFDANNEHIRVFLNGTQIGLAFEEGDECPVVPSIAEIVLHEDTFNSLVGKGDAVIDMVFTDAVEPCDPDGGYVTVTLLYDAGGSSSDSNGNSIPDECDCFDDSECDNGQVCVDAQCLPDPACNDDDGDGRVTICHMPPGNLSNARTIIVNVNAVPRHLAHGDQCGPCEDGG